jgi:hypothetical protein
VALTAIFDVDLYYVEQVRNNEYVYSNMKKLFFAAKDGCAVANRKWLMLLETCSDSAHAILALVEWIAETRLQKLGSCKLLNIILGKLLQQARRTMKSSFRHCRQVA